MAWQWQWQWQWPGFALDTLGSVNEWQWQRMAWPCLALTTKGMAMGTSVTAMLGIGNEWNGHDHGECHRYGHGYPGMERLEMAETHGKTDDGAWRVTGDWGPAHSEG
jgi:hypothetical protein